MFYAKFISNGQEHAELYSDFQKYFADTFSPDTVLMEFIDFTIHGKTYSDRKRSLYDIAVAWSNSDSAGLYLDEIGRATSELQSRI